MNPVLRLFGMKADDWTRVVVKHCEACGQPICEERVVRPLTALEQAVVDYQNDLISVEQFEACVGAALAAKAAA